MVDTHTFPNGGWAFRQPQTNWTNPMNMVGFKSSVDAIRKHRISNPAIASKYNLSTDASVIEQELISFQRARGALPPERTVSPSFFQSARNSQPNAVGVAGNLKRAAQGTAVVLDWLGSGADPVAQELAEKRAAICVACPNNEAGSWFTEAPAELIRSTVKAWQAMKGSNFAFETSQGDKLKSCAVCKCLMSLKVFVDLSHIVSKTKPEIMAEFPEHCWIAKRDQ